MHVGVNEQRKDGRTMDAADGRFRFRVCMDGVNFVTAGNGVFFLQER